MRYLLGKVSTMKLDKKSINIVHYINNSIPVIVKG